MRMGIKKASSCIASILVACSCSKINPAVDVDVVGGSFGWGGLGAFMVVVGKLS